MLAESAALKAKLQGLVVHDSQTDPDTGRPVTVRFRQADATNQNTYPLVLLDFLAIAPAQDRLHSGGATEIEYVPGVADQQEGDPEDFGWISYDWPVAVDLLFQVMTLTVHPLHDSELVAQMLSPAFFPFFPGMGFIEIDADGTVRRVDCESFSPAPQINADGRWLFRSLFQLRVASEMLLGDVAEITRVQTVNIEAPDAEHPGYAAVEVPT